MTEQHNIWLCMGEHENRDILRTNHTIELKKKTNKEELNNIVFFRENQYNPDSPNFLHQKLKKQLYTLQKIHHKLWQNQLRSGLGDHQS